MEELEKNHHQKMEREKNAINKKAKQLIIAPNYYERIEIIAYIVELTAFAKATKNWMKFHW